MVGPVPVGEPLVVVAATGVGEAAAVLLPVLRHQRPRRGSTAATSTMNGGGQREGGTESEGLSCNSGGDLVGGSWLIARDELMTVGIRSW